MTHFLLSYFTKQVRLFKVQATGMIPLCIAVKRGYTVTWWPYKLAIFSCTFRDLLHWREKKCQNAMFAIKKFHIVCCNICAFFTDTHNHWIWYQARFINPTAIPFKWKVIQIRWRSRVRQCEWTCTYDNIRLGMDVCDRCPLFRNIIKPDLKGFCELICIQHLGLVRQWFTVILHFLKAIPQNLSQTVTGNIM